MHSRGSYLFIITIKFAIAASVISTATTSTFILSINIKTALKIPNPPTLLMSKNQDWFTSGYRVSNGTLRWASDGSQITADFFPTQAVRDEQRHVTGLDIPKNRIVYRYDGERLLVASLRHWRHRPKPVADGSKHHLPLPQHALLPHRKYDDVSCAGLPCFGKSQTHVQMVQATHGPYLIINDRLTIFSPTESEDASFYTCEATNEFGTVQSNPIEVSYGFLGEFSYAGVSATYATMFMGVEISCQDIQAKPGLAYSWYKESIGSFVFPDLNPHFFLSKNGKLYISEVQASDQATYQCIVSMMAKQGQVLAADQATSRISMPIKVLVNGQSKYVGGDDRSNDIVEDDDDDDDDDDSYNNDDDDDEDADDND
ncbi:contactin [Plakobranchus ocellatus]|uniref:Contactin n=1 Tax=Plakobranchus ocellatus TaxID=259542 RepID=A0AAV4DWW3_9GAST|nr:contactin [Plakobranchus ocellatus]